MAVTISGAVILEKNSGRLICHQKCERCGHSPTTVLAIGTPTGANKLTTTFKCPTCGNQQRIEIAGR